MTVARISDVVEIGLVAREIGWLYEPVDRFAQAALEAGASAVLRLPLRELPDECVVGPQALHFAAGRPQPLLVADDGHFTLHQTRDGGGGLADRNLEVAAGVDDLADSGIALGQRQKCAHRV